MDKNLFKSIDDFYDTLDKLDTFGWSAEQILFDVFDMVTDRNYYLSIKIQEIINEISSINPNDQVIDKMKANLKKYDLTNLNESDPLKLILQKILE